MLAGVDPLVELARCLERGESAALCTIVQIWGSSPREAGARMLVKTDGSILGTVGGGCGEAEVWQQAQEVFSSRASQIVHVDLTESPDTDSPKVCGGRLDVLVELWEPTGLPEVKQLLKEGSTSLTAIGVDGPPAWKLSKASPRPSVPVGTRYLKPTAAMLEAAQEVVNYGRLALDGVAYFVEHRRAKPRLVIAGAGHIARPLYQMADLCGFAVTVVDDRADYARQQDFPGAEVLCQDFREAFRGLTLNCESYVVLVTRGHRHDEDCLRELVGQELAYIGMIGSKRRTRAVRDDLLKEGVEPAWWERVCAPIGLDIGAQSPEEIAVCILAEMIQMRRRGCPSVVSLSTGKRTGVLEGD